jgi:hypothetical protein
MLMRTVSALCFALLLVPAPALAVDAPLLAPLGSVSPCDEDPGFAKLDFWVGEWDAFEDDRLAGTNRIVKVLAGCAIEEHWTGAGGSRGQSLFYYLPASKQWKQVWVTENVLRPGGIKEKSLIAELENGGIRFLGVIALPSGGSYLDRTTLTPLPDGSVRQHIEVSEDEGTTWRSTFDAVYRRRG